MSKLKPKISRSSEKIKRYKEDPTIMEVFEKVETTERRLVGYQYYNPETKGFTFVFDKSYPKNLRKLKREEMLNLSGALGIPIKIKEGGRLK